MKKLRFKIYIIVGMFIFLNLIFCAKTHAASSSTYFYGEPISIEQRDNIEIISNEVIINTEKSKIENKFLIKNNANQEIKSKIFIKLEDSKISTSINDLQIKVNDVEITKIYKEKEQYVFEVKIPANEGNKIQILYNTDNNLRNAKVLKYTLNNIKGKHLKYFKIDVIFPEADIPLVNGIYPEYYKFDNNKISIEYYDFNVNALTKDFVIEKQTYKNLLYGQDYELNNYQKKVINNAEKWIKNGIVEDPMKYYEGEENSWFVFEKMLKDILKTDEENITQMLFDKDGNKEIKSIIYYALAKSFSKKNIQKEFPYPYSIREDWEYILTADYIENKFKDKCPLYGLTIAVDYIKSEGDKELYVYKHISGEESNAKFDYVKYSEWDILKTKNRRMWYDYEQRRGLKTIHINQDITGAEIEATDSEKIEYINMINPSLYARFTIYDGDVKSDINEYEKKLATGYYGEENLQIAKIYNNAIQEYEQKKFERETIYVDYDNDVIAKKCMVPNLAHNVGYREKIGGKYVISYYANYFYHSDGYGDIKEAINCDRAKKLQEENEVRLSKVRGNVKNEIANIKISDIKMTEDFQKDEPSNNIEVNMCKDKIIYGTIIVLILILIIFIIILLIRRGKNNGRKK